MSESEIERTTRWETWLATRLTKLDTAEIIRLIGQTNTGLGIITFQLLLITVLLAIGLWR